MKMTCKYREICKNTVCEHYYPHEHSSNCRPIRCDKLGYDVYCEKSIQEVRKIKLDKIKNL